MPIIAGRASAAYGAGFAKVISAGSTTFNSDYEALASITLASTASEVSFSGIPQHYYELQIMFTGYSNNADGVGLGNVRVSGFFNDDTTATNYYNQFVAGNGESASSGTENAAKYMGNVVRTSQTAPGTNVVSIMDYSLSNKLKNVLTLTGFNNNDTNISNQGVRIVTGTWNNTDPITKITLVPELGSFKQNSIFTLFGVK